MGKVGIIAVIPKDYSEKDSPFEAALKRNGYSRVPGTANYIFPYKDVDNKYRTGLDPEAGHVKRIRDEQERAVKIKQIEADIKFIKASLGDDFDISPRSKYYNYSLNTGNTDELHVHPVKLKDGDNYFNLDNPKELLTFRWLSSHPTIASSYEDYLAGKYAADTMFYVKETEVEEEIKYRKKQAVNKAIAKLAALSVEKQKKVARMLGLGVGDTTLPTQIYNMLDEHIQRGERALEQFHAFADMNDELLYIKDLLEQALYHQVFREARAGKIEEGGQLIGESKEDVVEWLMKDQKELLALEQKVKAKRIVLS